MSNRLANSTSPYLLQHADNPVDWYPWGEEAFAAAQAADRPIFLSIGYSSCHWCHVMAHESFEDAGIAAQLRESFISIKVDREERPDIDSIYMTALQIFFQMIGAREGGGWPLSMFLTPDGKPFYGGTYWPPVSKYGRPGFGDVLTAIAGFWRDRRQDTLAQAEQLTAYLRSDARGRRADDDESEHRGAAALADNSLADIAQRGASFVADQGEELLRHAAAQLERNFDPQFGGFGAAPKFPHPLDLRLLLRLARRFQKPRLQELALFTLDKMARGGIFDQLGGGFHRYSVDAQWLVPHFEKMLYDNAMLATAYLEAHQSSGRADLAEVAQATLDYLLREMTDPAGGFYSAQDADSEGVEGEFFVWTPAQIADVLGEELAARFCSVYDVSESGNFEGRNIPHRAHTWEQSAALLKCDVDELRRSMAEARRKLLAARESRIKPGLDDKVLVNWNALAIEAFALGGLVLRDEKYLTEARNAADFILAKLRTEEGRLLHAWRDGDARYAAYLDDYACLIAALQRLFEATQDERYAAEAVRLAEVALRHFADPGAGTFFYTADDHETLIARQKDAHDNPTPSGNGMLAMSLARLGQLTGRSDFRETAAGIVAAFGDSLRRMPGAMAQMLLAVDWELGPTQEVVVTAPKASSAQALLRDLQARFAPHCVFIARGADQPEPDPVLAELLAGKPIGEEPQAYVCQGFACQAPVQGAAGIAELWAQLAPQNFG